MQLRYSTDPTELMLIGSRDDYRRLAHLIEKGEGEFLTAIQPDEHSYPHPVHRVSIGQSAGNKVSIRLDVSLHKVNIVGDQKWLTLLADNLREYGAEADINSHQHVEYFENHFYLAPGTVPLVCCLEEG